MGEEAVLTDDPEVIRRATHVIFPGQGEARHAMDYLREKHLDQCIKRLTQPVLGICIGQQLLCRHSEEGNVKCLGLFEADVVAFNPTRASEKVPHMGWNTLELGEEEGILKGCQGQQVYFVHSFYVPPCEWTLAQTTHIVPFSAALHRDNFWATQFHPEKSGPVGERILHNFLSL